MFDNSKSLTEGFKVGVATPIDDRLVFNDLSELQAAIAANPQLPLSFYRGMVITLTANESQYVWKVSNDGLLPTSFTYPNGYTVNNVNYSLQVYNFKPIFVVVEQPYYAEGLNILANTEYNITHSLNTEKVILHAWENNEPVLIDYTVVNANTIALLSSEDVTIDIKVSK